MARCLRPDLLPYRLCETKHWVDVIAFPCRVPMSGQCGEVREAGCDADEQGRTCTGHSAGP